MSNYAYFTLASDDFVPGVICLAKSLKISKFPDLHVIDLDINKDNKTKLYELGCVLHKEEKLTSKLCLPQAYRENPNFANNAFNKIHVWNQNFDKIIYLDADAIVLKNIDHLFELPYEFAAGSSFILMRDKNLAGWRSSFFNSGVFVLTPSTNKYQEMLNCKDSLSLPEDFSDQGFLNVIFANKWHRLPPIYNFTRRAFDIAKEKYAQLKNDICVYHYTLEKPWKEKKDDEFTQMWWKIYES